MPITTKENLGAAFACLCAGITPESVPDEETRLGLLDALQLIQEHVANGANETIAAALALLEPGVSVEIRHYVDNHPIWATRFHDNNGGTASTEYASAIEYGQTRDEAIEKAVAAWRAR